MKKKVLGRGLGVLIPESERTEALSNEIDIDRISPNPDQPRIKLDEQRLNELAASIRQNGVLQPILVRPLGDGYQLVAGERRLSAAQRAGLLKIPAVVRDFPDERLLELALIENIQRDDLNPIEEAQAYHNMVQSLNLSQEDLAQRLSKERSTIANSLRLLKLPPAVKLLVAEGKLSPGHARALLASGVSDTEMTYAANLICEKGWSVRDTERWAKKKAKPTHEPRLLDPDESSALDRLRLLFGTKVEMDKGPKGSGQIRIYFHDQEDLIRIYGLLTDKRQSNGAKL
jgi:ParB family transcriptional regulator, chromosome partitioning protein